MTPIRIFVSSVQREFAREREQLRVYLRGDPLMRHFFEVFLFEDVSASDRRPDEVEKLRVAHQSVPGNPLLAESMYLMRYIEKMGTGTVDMIRRCAEAGLPEPEFEVGSWSCPATTDTFPFGPTKEVCHGGKRTRGGIRPSTRSRSSSL